MEIRQARASEAALVAAVLSAAAEKLRERGEALWSPGHVSEAAVAPDVQRGIFHIAFDEDGAVGVFRFQLEDPVFWPELTDGSSAFIHSLAVVPHKQGREYAQVLLRHACELTRQCGRRWLRLDCVAGRPRLRAIYERFGFRHHSQLRRGNSVAERFELDVGTA